MTGELGLREVVQTFVKPDTQIWEVEVESVDGEVELIETTAEHPFYVDGLGWVPTSRLDPGDPLVGINGETGLTVRQVRGSPRTATVYNFEVKDFHTYFVGQAGVWVHNWCRVEIEANIAESRKARVARNVAKSRNARKNSGFAEHSRRVDKRLQQSPSRPDGGNAVVNDPGETVDLFRAVGVREFDSIAETGAFRPGGNSLEGRQFGFTLEEALAFVDADPTKVAIIKATIDRKALSSFDFSKDIDPFIFRNGVVTVQPGDQSDIFHRALRSIDHVF